MGGKANHGDAHHVDIDDLLRGLRRNRSGLDRPFVLDRLSEINEMLGDMIDPEDRLAFFEEPHPLLLEMRPIDLLETEEGTGAVRRIVEGMASGAFQ